MYSTSFELNKKTEKFDWWIEICTANPLCIYYFGAFDSYQDALLAKDGYIQDLKQEEAELSAVRIKQCKPTQLTIFDEELKVRDLRIIETTSAAFVALK